MGAFKDLTGCKFGELTVLSRAENRGKQTMWLCKCSCGNTKVIDGHNMCAGKSRSCGCKQAEAIRKYNDNGHRLRLEGKRFGRLVVVSQHYPPKRGNLTTWDCVCDCGKTCTVVGRDLVVGDTRSCGCLHDEMCSERATVHGLSRVGKRDPRYVRLYVMLSRCYNPNTPHYKDYGGRGIKVCYEWNPNENPMAIENWLRFCDETGFREDLTIEREDVNKDYSPENCKWVPIRDQSLNTRRTVRLSNGRSITRVCIELGLFERATDNMNLYRRIIDYYRRHGTLPKEVMDAAISQNKQHLLEGV